MSGEDLYRGAVALGQGLSGGGIEGMLQRERQKAELENAMAQLRLQAELQQKAKQAQWAHEAQIQAALDQEATGVYGSSGGGWVPSTGPDQTQVINAALSENSGDGSSGMFLPNERLMRYLLKAKPEAAGRLAASERKAALGSGLQENPYTSQKMDELAARSYQHLQSGGASAERAETSRQLRPFQVDTAQSRSNKGKREDAAAATLEQTLGLTPEDLGNLGKALSVRAKQRKLDEPTPRKETPEEKAQKKTEERLISEYADLFGDKKKDPGGKRSQAILRELQRINPGLVQALMTSTPSTIPFVGRWLEPTKTESLQLAPRGAPQPVGEPVEQPVGEPVAPSPDLKNKLYPKRKTTAGEEP